jgi:hypothetical protein
MYLAIETEETETDQGSNFIRVSDIKSIQCERGQWLAITNADKIHPTSWLDVVRATATIVPARLDEIAHNIYVVDPEAPAHYAQHRIIAWAVSPFMQPVPITNVGHLVDDFISEAIRIVLMREPDGTYRSYEGHTFNTIDEARQWLDDGGPAWLRAYRQRRSTAGA